MTGDAPGPGPSSPFVGLVPFAEEDAPFFFGRERATQIVTGNLRASRLTLVYGPSGVGKSSLLLAGAVHELRALVRENARRAVGQPPFAISVFRSWQDDPLPALVEQIRKSVAEACCGTEPARWRPGEPLLATLRSWTEQTRTLLVVMDQFEDYFRYHPGEPGQDGFGDALAAIVNEPNLHVNFLLSLREDALAKLDRFKGRIPRLFANYLRIDHLDPEAAKHAIRGPIEEWNRRLPAGEPPYSIEPELVDVIVDAAAAGELTLVDPGAKLDEAAQPDAVEATFLQLVLERLWSATVAAGSRELTLARLDMLGGCQRIVESHLDDALAGLGADEQATAADLFRYLVTRSKTKIAHPASDLADWLDRPQAEIAPVLDKLCSGEHGRILRAIAPAGGEEGDGLRYELFHDVLADPIIAWRTAFEHQQALEEEHERQRAIRRRVARLAALAVALLVVFAGLATWSFVERSNAVHQERRARSTVFAFQGIDNANDLRQQLVASLAANGERDAGYEARTTGIGALQKAAASHLEAILVGPTGFESVAVSNDGRLLATAGDDRIVRLWDARSHAELAALRGHSDQVQSVAFSPDGRTLASGGSDATVRLWDVGTRKQIASLPGPEGLVNSVKFSPDGRFLAAGDTQSTVLLWRTRTGGRVPRRDGTITIPGGAQVFATAFGDGGNVLAVASDDGFVRLYHPGGRRPFLAVRARRNGAVFGVAFSPNGDLLATASGPSSDLDAPGAAGLAHSVRLWNARDGNPKGPALAAPGVSYGIAFAPDGKRLAFAGNDGKIRLWQVAGRRHQTAVLAGHEGRVWILAFNKTGSLLASASADRTARIWRVPPATAPARRSPVEAAAFDPDGRLLATVNEDRIVQVWRPEAQAKPIRTLRLPKQDDVGAVAIAPGGRTLAIAGPSTRRVAPKPGQGSRYRVESSFIVQLWDIGTGKRLARVTGSGWFDPVTAVFGGRDGTSLALGSQEAIRVVHAVPPYSIGAPARARPAGEGEDVQALAATPDAKLATAGSELLLWPAPYTVSARLPMKEISYENVARSLAWSSRDVAALGTDDGTIILWNGQSKQIVGRLLGHDGPVSSLDFSADGTMLVSGSVDGTVRLWDVGRHRALGTPFHGDGGAIFRVAFDRDGTAFTSVDTTAGIHVWRGFLWNDAGELRRRICGLISGHVTQTQWDDLSGGLYPPTCVKISGKTR